jgi:acyl-coenzyme A synthetase/AMP-(fatty) acid ligase
LARIASGRGVGEGDWCVVRLEKPIDILVAVAGLTAIGAVPVLLSPRLDAGTVRAMLAPVTSPLHLLVTGTRMDELPELTGAGTVQLVWEEAMTGPMPLSGVVLPSAGIERDPGKPYLVTHTSGTTGIPKLAIHTRNGFSQQAAVQARMLRTMRLRGYLAAAISPVHVRTLSGLLSVLRLRLSVLLLQSEDPDVVGEHLERWRPEYLETHPNSYVTWEGLADSGAMSSVRMFLGTFDAVHPSTVSRMLAGSRRRLALFAEVYAQSELGPVAFRLSTRRSKDSARDIGRSLAGHRVGRSIPGYNRIRVVDAAGNVVPRGRAGRIQVRSKGRFAGYLNFPERFEENLAPDGWWDSGDWGARERGGALRLLDRQVERLGVAPSGIALEDVLLSRVPELAEVVVLERGSELLPVVVSKPSVTLTDERWSSATHDLPRLARPQHLRWDDIPRTATGKVRRELLRERVGE